jgi:salicylate hydroxylase
MSSLHVLVIGGGPGGLCLAQGLKKAGASLGVYEGDRAPTGSKALHACLPEHLYKAFVDSCGLSTGKITFATEGMDKLLQLDVRADDPVNSHKSVSRITLRQILLSGLEDVVHFGKTFTRYFVRDDGKIVAEFTDGSYASGDVIGADGGSSRVRHQFLPHAQRIDTGVVGIAGKLILNADNRNGIAQEFLDGMALIFRAGRPWDVHRGANFR